MKTYKANMLEELRNIIKPNGMVGSNEEALYMVEAIIDRTLKEAVEKVEGLRLGKKRFEQYNEALDKVINLLKS